jgi:hypothetical protein
LGKNVKKNQSFFVEDMDLFVTLNVATLKTFYVSQYSSNTYFIFVVSMERRGKLLLEMLEIMKKIITNLFTIVQNYYATG